MVAVLAQVLSITTRMSSSLLIRCSASRPGLLLPCNVCVWENEGGSTVSVLRPDKMVEFTGNPKLEPMAREADEKLRRALGRLMTGSPTGETDLQS